MSTDSKDTVELLDTTLKPGFSRILVSDCESDAQEYASSLLIELEQLNVRAHKSDLQN